MAPCAGRPAQLREDGYYISMYAKSIYIKYRILYFYDTFVQNSLRAEMVTKFRKPLN